ncbi:MAG: DNA-binding response regulator [Flavobacterium sp.]|uniref:response regulator transcription factor n=1 Tax=Flavobacterium sp. TaxID=239 RepID=UPI00326709FB
MKTKILIVEDELLIALDIKNILESEGYDTISNITSVTQAIQMIEKEKLSLVLIDLNLQKKNDGVLIGHYLLEKDTIPFIYITANSDKVSLEKAKETRPYGFIVKPFKPADIKTAVSIVLNNHQHKSIDLIRSSEPLKNEIPFRIKEIINYVNKNITEKIEIDDLVALTEWKKDHFIKMFNTYMHITPYQYILKIKIDKAKSLIEETNQPIAEIAQDLSFQSYSNFCIAFKKLNGNENPKAYRRKIMALRNIIK